MFESHPSPSAGSASPTRGRPRGDSPTAPNPGFPSRCRSPFPVLSRVSQLAIGLQPSIQWSHVQSTATRMGLEPSTAAIRTSRAVYLTDLASRFAHLIKAQTQVHNPALKYICRIVLVNSALVNPDFHYWPKHRYRQTYTHHSGFLNYSDEDRSL